MQSLANLREFLTERVDARALGMCRVAVGAAAFLRGLVSYHLIDRLFSEGYVRARSYPWIPDLSRETIVLFVVVWLVCSLLFTLGYRTRLSGAALTGLIAYHLYVDQNLFWSHIYFLGLLVLLLTLADSGAALSIDARRDGERGALRWPLVLLKVQVTLVYFYTALAKCNAAFLSGAVIADRFWMPTLFRQSSGPELLAWATIPLEFFLAFALWSRRLQPWAFLGGLIFHTLIPVLSHLYGGLIVFSMSVLGSYMAFLDWGRESRVVEWEGRRRFPSWLARWARRLDWWNALQFREGGGTAQGDSGEATSEGFVLRVANRKHEGFDALVEILSALPISFLWAAVLRIPPAHQVGRWLYSRSAGSDPGSRLPNYPQRGC